MNIDLTRRRHYTFEQVANHLQCSVDDLHYYVIAGELSPSLYLSGRQLPEYLMLPGEHYDTDGHVEPNERTSTEDHDHGVAHISSPRGFLHLVLGRQTSAFDCEFQFAASKPNGFDIGDVVFMLESPIGLDKVFESCVVMATELNRFSTSHPLQHLASGPAPVAEVKPLETTERNTLLKLVIGMAIDGYGYDPKAKKSNVPKEVADAISALGMGMTDDTVRKYLKEAVTKVLPAKPSQP